MYGLVFLIAWNISAWVWEYVQVLLHFNKMMLRLVDVSPKLAVCCQLTER